MTEFDRPVPYAALVKPRSVAIVGASDTPGKTTARPLEFLRLHGWVGQAFPINPNHPTVMGEPAWPSLLALPMVPEHVLILTPADAALQAVADCAALGVRVATIIADGFSPNDPLGLARRARLQSIMQGSQLRVLGPGSLGLANLHEHLVLTGNAAFADSVLPVGDIFVASQSGSVIGALLSRGAEMGLGFSAMVSTGGELDLSLGEICKAAVDDPRVASFALFLENLSSAGDLTAFAVAAAEHGKPIVAYKLGRSDEAARLAVSHTGALAGDDAIAGLFLDELGIARVMSFEALLESQHLARRTPVNERHSAGPRVGVVSTTGGGGAMIVDCLAGRGAVVTRPTTETAGRLADLGVHLGSGALVDLTLAGANYQTIRSALEVMVAASEFDLIVAVPGSSARFTPEVSVAPIVDCADRGSPLVAFVLPSAPQALHMLRANGVPAFRTPEACADAVMAVFRRRPARSRTGIRPPVHLETAVLDEVASYAVLSTAGIASSACAVISVDDLPSELPVLPPVAVKILTAEVAHKSDVGGVALGIGDAAELAVAVDRIRSAVSRARPGVAVTHVLVQQMVTGVTEALIGLRRDRDVGPVVIVAAGGVFTELYNDRSLRLAPVTVEEARQMITEVRGLMPAAGFRGSARGDLEALAHAVANLSRLANLTDPLIAEAEVNPIVVLAEGDGVVAVDAVVSIYRGGQ